MKLDTWQQKVLDTKGNICLRSGRQVGKSTIIALKAANYALDNPKKLIMVISKTDRQASLLFSKILVNVQRLDKKQIKSGKDRPTKHLINLKNGSTIHSLPCGDTGFGIMGFTIHLLIADEAAFIPEEVWNSLIPALAATSGNIWLLSTPFVKEGYYYNAFQNPNFEKFHTSSEDCPRIKKSWLEEKKAECTKAQYAQMYLGQFVDELRQFFPDNLIAKRCIAQRRDRVYENKDYTIGCDVARMDRDEFTYEIMDITNIKDVIHVENIMTKNIPITSSAKRIIYLNKQYDFDKEYIDSGGMGIAVCDILRDDDDNRRKVVEINNAQRSYEDTEGKERRRKIMKEDLYNNLKGMMERGDVTLLDDDEVKLSLKSIQAEHHKDSGKLKIWGKYSHITEGIIRAVWGARNKGLNIYIC